ncbi:phage shock protein A [Pseudoalteromonas sp. MSK9-3]|uniref:PspA/IM30 family protein n=1 Tax=Pseudoalteromonas sp. MSK9-3 TaxID=1897633 RepID=UPI000E6BFE61|nr:PspA/IM30 family protein [Pseudoalteromonas sp. MSK9-3]RJE75693.1 phage shock protein A [Pseudoalteromonas sp. MSK9-3]
MALINRIEDLIKSEVSAFLDKAEDPKKMTAQIKIELQDTLAQCRATAATVMCEQKSLSRKIAAHQKQVNDWQQKAEHALSKDREDLAKAALSHKHTAQAHIEAAQPQLVSLSDALAKLNDDADRIVAKITALNVKEQQLSRHERVVSARARIRQTLACDEVESVLTRFTQLERKVDRIESEVDSYDLGQQSTQAQFDALEKEEQLSSELAKLKQQVAEKSQQAAN